MDSNLKKAQVDDFTNAGGFLKKALAQHRVLFASA
jgi:hypothetical protein